jgi:hypothetical protein
MSVKQMPDRHLLLDLLIYEPDTGKLFWKPRGVEFFKNVRSCRTWNVRYAGKPALWPKNCDGYRSGSLLGVHAKAHRIIWKMMTGEEPDVVDHVNGCRTDNRWANLRSTTWEGNARNVRFSRHNTSGCMGVARGSRAGSWRAYIRGGGEQVHLGTFNTKEEAIAARKAAEREHGFHPNHGRAA